MAPAPRSLGKTVFLAAAVLGATGVLAGQGVRAVWLMSYSTERFDNPATVITGALACVVICLGLLYFGWRPLAGLATSSPSRGRALVAVLITAALLVATTPIVMVLVGVPYNRIYCADAPPESWCEFKVLYYVPTAGAVLPWTLAGLLPLAAMTIAARRQQTRPATLANS